MELANRHMAQMLNEIQEQVLHEDKALSKEKAVARVRAKIPPPQTKLGDTTTAKELKKKGIKMIVLDHPDKVAQVHEAIEEALDGRED